VHVSLPAEWVEQLLVVFEEMMGEWEAQQEDPETADSDQHFRYVFPYVSLPHANSGLHETLQPNDVHRISLDPTDASRSISKYFPMLYMHAGRGNGISTPHSTSHQAAPQVFLIMNLLAA
jgi:hypothetical protein